MKRWLAILLILTLALLLFGCRTMVNKNAEVTLIFIYESENIQVTLTDEEAAKVTQILDGNAYDPSVLIGFPSCGFNENVAIKVGDRRFAIACDTCNCVLDLGNGLFFDVSKEDISYIHSLFERYGGYFPCT